MKKAISITLIILFSVAFCGFVAYEICKLPMNSDSSCMMLEAEDILHGNIFLSGWNLTGISFITTDLPWYIISVAVFGVGLNAYRLAVFLMFIFMTCCAMPLVFHNVGNKALAFCITAAMGLFPTTYALSNTFVHTAVFALSFLAIFIINSYNEKPTNAKLALFIIVTALAVCGDYTSFALIIAPIIILGIFRAFEKNFHVLISTFSAAVLGIIIEKAYLFIGGANLNALTRTQFSDIRSIPGNISLYIEYCLKLINSSFFGKNLFSIKTGIYGLKICIALFAIYVIFQAVKSALYRKETDIPTSALGIGFILITLLLCLSDMTTDITTGRYICFAPLMLAIVLSRTTNIISIKTKTIKIIIYGVFITLAFSAIAPHGSSYSPYNTYSDLAEYLESENLTNGYGAFWDSYVINGYSGNKVKVNAVKCTDNGVAPRLWFCKTSWFDTKSNFVLIRREDAAQEEFNYNYNSIYNMHLAATKQHGKTFEKPFTYEAVISYFGKPEQIKHFRNYDILIYDELQLAKE